MAKIKKVSEKKNVKSGAAANPKAVRKPGMYKKTGGKK